MTNPYSNGKIYKLVNSVDGRIYVGSTCNVLSKRLAEHKRAARQNPTRCVYEALNDVGWENVRIVLIEAFRCTNKEELTAREQYFMDMLRPSLNKQAASGQICEHQHRRSQCKECGSASICQHNRQRAQCKDCGGSSICEHNRKRDQCKECGGSGICEHQRLRNQCKECSGSSICEHQRVRNYCKHCNPMECDFCEIIICKGNYNNHCRSAAHKANESAEFLRVFGFPMD